MKRIFRSLLVLALLFCLLSAAAGYFLCESALHPAKRKLTERSRQKALTVAARNHSVMKEVFVQAKDDITLNGWYFQAPNFSDQTAILLHGLSDNRSGMLGYTEFVLRHGYNVLTPDWRAHGQSEGTLATYGIIEKDDLQLWIDWAETFTNSKNYYALGESYGAAILLQSLEREKRICAAVAECSFSTFREAAYDRMGQQIGLGKFAGATIFLPIVKVGLLTASSKYSLDLEQANPLKSLQATQVPVLLIHGDLDNNIPVRHSRLLFEQTKKNGHVEFWEVQSAGHSSAHGKSPQEYESRVIGWFEKHKCLERRKL